MQETLNVGRERVWESFIPVGVEISEVQEPEGNPLKVGGDKHTESGNEEGQHEDGAGSSDDHNRSDRDLDRNSANDYKAKASTTTITQTH